MALGATQNGILGLIVRNGMILTLYGVAAGVLGSFLLSRLLRSLLFGVGATDAATFLVIPVLLTLIAFMASYVPARRAAWIDPATSLRYD